MVRGKLATLRRLLWVFGALVGAALVVLLFLVSQENASDAGGAAAESTTGVPGQPSGEGKATGKPWYADKPGVSLNEPKISDVQEWDWLKQDLERLVQRTRPRARRRLSPEEFRKEFAKATVEYLKLDEEARARFEHSVATGLEKLDLARQELRQAQEATEFDLSQPETVRPYRGAWDQFREKQREIARQVASSLEEKPRTQLLREQALRWVMRLDYGIRAARRGM